jgi:hypothetical protein
MVFYLKPMVYMVLMMKVAQIDCGASDWVGERQNVGQFVSSLIEN